MGFKGWEFHGMNNGKISGTIHHQWRFLHGKVSVRTQYHFPFYPYVGDFVHIIKLYNYIGIREGDSCQHHSKITGIPIPILGGPSGSVNFLIFCWWDGDTTRLCRVSLDVQWIVFFAAGMLIQFCLVYEDTYATSCYIYSSTECEPESKACLLLSGRWVGKETKFALLIWRSPGGLSQPLLILYLL
jgi:hypothetical protein